ncbi:MAG: hypothetical protein RLZZ328_1404 [Bacteroidota bacterium]|jgi:hypothetical protein
MAEYAIGSIITIILLFVWSYKFNKTQPVTQAVKISYRQSSIHEVVKPYLSLSDFAKEPKKTQARNIRDRNHIRIIFIDGLAYWIANNSVYVADTNESGVIKESARIVDMMGINSVELDKMLFIMDKLTDRNTDDSGSSGL